QERGAADGERVLPAARRFRRGVDAVLRQAVAVEVAEIDEPGGGGKPAAVRPTFGAEDEEAGGRTAAQVRQDDRLAPLRAAAGDRIGLAGGTGGAGVDDENRQRGREAESRHEPDDDDDGMSSGHGVSFRVEGGTMAGAAGE